MTRLLIIGATSAIAHEVARDYARDKAQIYLVARNASALEANAADLRVRGAEAVAVATLDARDVTRHAEVLDRAWPTFSGFDAVLIAYGTLPDETVCRSSVAATLEAFEVNATSVIALMTAIAERLEAAGAGVLAVISSPAGERGRASNYTYGAAKAAVTAFASGLRHRLHAKGVRVLTIVPGFVDTPMTASFPKSALWSRPERVGKDIHRALDRGFGVIYTPSYWRWIMAIVRHVPERLFVRTQL
jgi:decaprenylphospho-beta-D-erythro-pentofuranosid-2-ulose 2-reductase